MAEPKTIAEWIRAADEGTLRAGKTLVRVHPCGGIELRKRHGHLDEVEVISLDELTARWELR